MLFLNTTILYVSAKFVITNALIHMTVQFIDCTH